MHVPFFFWHENPLVPEEIKHISIIDLVAEVSLGILARRGERVSDLVEGNNLDEMRQEKVELEGSLQDLNLDRISLSDQIQQLQQMRSPKWRKRTRRSRQSQVSLVNLVSLVRSKAMWRCWMQKEVAATVPAGESHAEG